MATIARLTLVHVVLLGLSIVLTPGCFFMEGQLDVGVDGATSAQIKVGVNRALLEAGAQKGQDPLAEAGKDLPEGWTVSPFEDETWKGLAIRGEMPAGQPTMPDSNLRVEVIRRLLSTDYIIQGTLSSNKLAPTAGGEDMGAELPEPAGDTRPEAAETAGSEGGGEESDDLATLGDKMAPLLSALAQTPYLAVTVRAPGTVVETSGQEVAPGAAQWRVELTQLGDDASVELPLLLRTRLLNSQNIGRLADRLTVEHRIPDAAGRVAAAIARGLLPNPPREEPLKAELDVDSYAALLTIIAVLDDAVGPAVTHAVVNALGLNSDSVTGETINCALERVRGLSARELAQVAAEAVAARVRAGN